ncbi:BQ2448_7076 [Microbotryum intermedium]|uniref:BQ2448_7076 protein n=1 Tax=Microbotryum intermedium TaxID=269621 RepID=A0A238FLW4_9BASI|nr:BQ2448_7076 [Microbotryum intermedium]
MAPLSASDGPGYDGERNVDPARSFPDFHGDKHPHDSDTSIDVHRQGKCSPAADSPNLDHSATSALGFMPYFANGDGLQLSTQVPIILGSPHNNHFAPIQGDAGSNSVRQYTQNASSLSSQYAPSPLGAIAPWYEHDGPMTIDQTSQALQPHAFSWPTSAFTAAPPPAQGGAHGYSSSPASQPFILTAPSLQPPYHAINNMTPLEESVSNTGDGSLRLEDEAHDAPEHFLDQAHTLPQLDSSQHFQDSQAGSQYSYYTTYRHSSASASSPSSLVMHGSPYTDHSIPSATPQPTITKTRRLHCNLCPSTYRPSTPGELRTLSSPPTLFTPHSRVYRLLLAPPGILASGMPIGMFSPNNTNSLSLLGRTRNASSVQAQSPRTRHTSTSVAGANRVWPSPKTSVSRALTGGLAASPHTPTSPQTLPSSPSTPLLESFYDPTCPTVVYAKANRVLVGASPSATPSPASTPAGTPIVANVKDLPMIKQGRVLVESDAFCTRCHRLLASLILRGREDQFRAPYPADFVCFRCQPPIDEKGVPVIPRVDEKDRDAITYENSVSALLDSLSGVDIQATEEKAPQGRGKIAFAGSKKRKVDVEPLTCDVCQRDLAAGGLILRQTDPVVDLMIEVVCVSCAAKYQRCSDCGGGGGGRVGIGKWRCKEVFRDGRRNCSLSHVRQGPHDMQAYEIWSTSEVPSEELDLIISAMREVTISAIMSMGAIPDILEAPTPLARTYDELQRYAVDTWSVVEPLARMDEKAEPHIRRYFALRWTTPHKRKKKEAESKAKSAKSASAPAPDSETEQGPSDGHVVMRKNKTLASFIFGELDLSLGSAFPMLVIPKGIGDAYDQNTILMQKMLNRMTKDVVEINASRIRNRQTPWPKLDEVWTMVVFKKESSFLNRTGARRGFMPLQEYSTRKILLNDRTVSTISPRTEHVTSRPN